MQLNPYLFFNGQCQTAFQFYERCLGGKVKTIMPYEGSPMEDQVPPEWRNKVRKRKYSTAFNKLGCTH